MADTYDPSNPYKLPRQLQRVSDGALVNCDNAIDYVNLTNAGYRDVGPAKYAAAAAPVVEDTQSADAKADETAKAPAAKAPATK